MPQAAEWDKAGDFAWRFSMTIMSDEHTRKPEDDRAAQMGCLKFWPAKRALSPSSSSILNQGEDILSKWLRSTPKLCISGLTYRSSWLYLARRSDRQGAPVLIWKNTHLIGRYCSRGLWTLTIRIQVSRSRRATKAMGVELVQLCS